VINHVVYSQAGCAPDDKKYLINTLHSNSIHKDNADISGNSMVFLLQHPFSLQLITRRKTNKQITMNDRMNCSILPKQKPKV